jgi:hypothetical protein
MRAITFTATIEALPDTPCLCGNCGWRGSSADTRDIGSTSLQAGHPVPAGRCPDCDDIVHPERPEDRASWAAFNAARSDPSIAPPTPIMCSHCAEEWAAHDIEEKMVDQWQCPCCGSWEPILRDHPAALSLT